MKNVTKKEFIESVRHEVEMLKKHGFKKEFKLLDFDAFKPAFSCDCIYGQMTGYCGGDRAKTLMDKSCIRIFDTSMSDQNGSAALKGMAFGSIKGYVNGKNEGQGWYKTGGRRYSYLSALESDMSEIRAGKYANLPIEDKKRLAGQLLSMCEAMFAEADKINAA